MVYHMTSYFILSPQISVLYLAFSINIFLSILVCPIIVQVHNVWNIFLLQLSHNITPLLRFFQRKNLGSFQCLQFLSNFFKYSSLNFLLSHPYNSLAVYLLGNSPLWSSLTLFILSSYISSYSSINSFVFFKFSFFFQVFSSTVYPFHLTKYSYFLCLFFLFNSLSTLYSFSPSIITGAGGIFSCPLTYSLYLYILLTFTTG